MPYRFKVLALQVVDGDSVHVTFDMGFRITHKTLCRMAHINTPEGKDGLAAKQWLEEALYLGAKVFEVETSKADKYGRWLVEIFYQQPTGGWLSLNQELLRLGLALPYEGGKR